MTQEIMDLVAKSLPAMQVEALRSELAKAATVVTLQQTIKERDATIAEHRKTTADLERRARSWDDLEAKQKAVDVREQKLEVELLKEQLKSKDYCISMQKELMQCAFKSPVYHKYTNEQIPVPSGTFLQNHNKSETISQD